MGDSLKNKQKQVVLGVIRCICKLFKTLLEKKSYIVFELLCVIQAKQTMYNISKHKLFLYYITVMHIKITLKVAQLFSGTHLQM